MGSEVLQSVWSPEEGWLYWDARFNNYVKKE